MCLISEILVSLCVSLIRRLLGIITKKDVLRHMAHMMNQDPESIMFNWSCTHRTTSDLLLNTLELNIRQCFLPCFYFTCITSSRDDQLLHLHLTGFPATLDVKCADEGRFFSMSRLKCRRSKWERIIQNTNLFCPTLRNHFCFVIIY